MHGSIGYTRFLLSLPTTALVSLDIPSPPPHHHLTTTSPPPHRHHPTTPPLHHPTTRLGPPLSGGKDAIQCSAEGCSHTWEHTILEVAYTLSAGQGDGEGDGKEDGEEGTGKATASHVGEGSGEGSGDGSGDGVGAGRAPDLLCAKDSKGAVDAVLERARQHPDTKYTTTKHTKHTKHA